MFEIYYGVLPGEIPDGIPQRRLIRLGYRISKAGLMAPEPLPAFSGGILGLGSETEHYDAEEIAKALIPFAKARGLSEIWLDMQESQNAKALAELFFSREMPFSAPFKAKGGGLVFSSAVCSGSISQTIEKAKTEAPTEKLTLEFSPVSTIFRAGAGPEPFARAELFRLLMRSPAVSFSEKLLANTISFREADGTMSFVLFDDEKTLSKKLELAAEMGVPRVFLRYNASQDLKPRNKTESLKSK